MVVGTGVSIRALLAKEMDIAKFQLLDTVDLILIVLHDRINALAFAIAGYRLGCARKGWQSRGIRCDIDDRFCRGRSWRSIQS